MIQRIRRSGTELHVWTVNSKADLDLCLEHGVSAVITDRPKMMLDYLGA
jgi:glycerophosphoryl diester phosphodiesterase